MGLKNKTESVTLQVTLFVITLVSLSDCRRLNVTEIGKTDFGKLTTRWYVEFDENAFEQTETTARYACEKHRPFGQHIAGIVRALFDNEANNKTTLYVCLGLSYPRAYLNNIDVPGWYSMYRMEGVGYFTTSHHPTYKVTQAVPPLFIYIDKMWYVFPSWFTRTISYVPRGRVNMDGYSKIAKNITMDMRRDSTENWECDLDWKSYYVGSGSTIEEAYENSPYSPVPVDCDDNREITIDLVNGKSCITSPGRCLCESFAWHSIAECKVPKPDIKTYEDNFFMRIFWEIIRDLLDFLLTNGINLITSSIDSTLNYDPTILVQVIFGSYLYSRNGNMLLTFIIMVAFVPVAKWFLTYK